MIEQFYNLLKQIDDHCNTEGFRVNLFGQKNANKYCYQPLVRSPDDEEKFQPI